MRKLQIILSLPLILGIIFSSAFAFAEENERPSLLEDFFLTESVYPQDQGETQVTLVSAYSSAEEEKTTTFGAGIEYGLTDQFQVEVGWNAFKSIDPDGFDRIDGSGDVEVGFKYTFETCPNTGIQMAAGFEVALPVGNEDVSDSVYVYEPYLVFSKDLGEDANLHLSLGYGFVDPESGSVDIEGNDEVSVSLGSVYRLAEDWRLTLEASLESNKLDNGDETEIYLAPGFLWKGIEDIEAGLAVAAGLNDTSDDWQLLGMVSFEF